VARLSGRLVARLGCLFSLVAEAQAQEPRRVQGLLVSSLLTLNAKLEAPTQEQTQSRERVTSHANTRKPYDHYRQHALSRRHHQTHLTHLCVEFTAPGKNR
jgi:hypothetical protein